MSKQFFGAGGLSAAHCTAHAIYRCGKCEEAEVKQRREDKKLGPGVGKERAQAFDRMLAYIHRRGLAIAKPHIHLRHGLWCWTIPKSGRPGLVFVDKFMEWRARQ